MIDETYGECDGLMAILGLSNRQQLIIFLGVILVFILGRSLLDYAVCMWGLDVVGPYWAFYAQFLLWSGLILFVALRQWKPQYILVSGLAVFLCENTFYIWVNIFGNLNGCYDWYSGNPLNPDGFFGYSWTNPLGMMGFFIYVMFHYVLIAIIFMMSQYLLRKVRLRLQKRY